MQQRWGDLSGRTVCWIGDYNNVARSLSLAAAMTGMAKRIAFPPGYAPTDVDVERLIAAGAPAAPFVPIRPPQARSAQHTTEIPALMRVSNPVLHLKNKK